MHRPAVLIAILVAVAGLCGPEAARAAQARGALGLLHSIASDLLTATGGDTLGSSHADAGRDEASGTTATHTQADPATPGCGNGRPHRAAAANPAPAASEQSGGGEIRDIGDGDRDGGLRGRPPVGWQSLLPGSIQ